MNGWHAAANRSETCTLFSRDIDVSTTNAQLIMAVCFAALLVGLLGLLGYSVYKNQKAAKQATLHATAPAVTCPLGIMPSTCHAPSAHSCGISDRAVGALATYDLAFSDRDPNDGFSCDPYPTRGNGQGAPHLSSASDGPASVEGLPCSSPTFCVEIMISFSSFHADHHFFHVV